MASISKTVRPKRSNNASVNPVGHGLTVGRGTPVVVGAGATTITVTTHPAGAVNGVTFTTQPVVQLRNGSGSAVAESGITVTAYLSSGSGTLGGTKQVVTDANGIATFTNLSITGTGSHTVSFHALMSAVQTIWSDDVEVDRSSSYFEKDTASGRFGRAVDPQNGNLAWKSTYQSGTQVSHGNLHLAFGRTPDPSYMVPVYGASIDFGEVTAEFDVRHTIANPWTDKMYRCMVLSASNFSQAAISHAWANTGTQLFVDPASGTNAAGQVITTGYNDFANLTFMGIATGTAGVLGSTATTRKRIKIVTRLDAPGQSDGIVQQYVDGGLDAQKTGLAFVKTYTGYGINAAYFEAFTNTPQVQTYDRYFDNISVTGRARAVVAGNALSVSAGGGGTYPNEPSGYTRAFEHDFQALPSGSNGVAGTDWLVDSGGSNLSIAVDATAPYGDTNVMRTLFPNGHSSGNAPCNVTVDMSGDTGRRTNQYFSLRFKVEGANYENQAVGTKFGFLGYGESASGALNNGFFILRGTGTQAIVGSMALSFFQQDSVERNLDRNVGSGNPIVVGTWHHLEAVMLSNSSAGAANGVLKIWVDGTLTHNYSDVVWKTSGEPLGFRGWKWNPTWGGIGGTKTRDDYIRFAHVYLSGV